MAFALTEFEHYCFNLSVCASSRVTMWTGQHARNHGVTGNSLAADWAAGGGWTHALPKWLQLAGYRTAMFGKAVNRVITDTYVIPGVDDGRLMVDDSHLGGAHAAHAMSYVNFFLSVNGIFSQLTAGDTWTGADKVGYTTAASDARAAASSSAYQTDWLSRRTKTFLGTTTEPFYVELASWAPHGDSAAANKPVPASRHAATAFSATHNPSWNEADVSDKPKWLRDTVPAQMTGAQQTYADEYDVASKRALLAVDEMLYDVVRQLTALGLIDRTVIIVCADNGAVVGEHRLTSQTANSVKNVPYQPSVHSRLFVHWPTSVPTGGRPNVVVVKLDDTARHHFDAMTWMLSQVTATNAALVGNVDLCPTICDAARARPTIRPDGMSLAPLLDGRIAPAAFRDQLLIEYDTQDNSSVAEMPPWAGAVTADGRKYVRYEAFGGDPAETEFYDAAAVAADEMVASSSAQPDLDAAVAGMLTG